MGRGDIQWYPETRPRESLVLARLVPRRQSSNGDIPSALRL